jgi:NAD(P)-dependent dehydrogenase (short-subunit alcohol dehydrogenase family)
MKPKLKPINEQVIVLLGATSGIGLETSFQMVEKGAQVVIVGRSQEGLNEALEQVRSHAVANRMAISRGRNGHAQEGGMGEQTTSLVGEMEDQVIGLEADVANFDQIKSVAEQVVQRFGRIDTWVNLAAVSQWALFEDTTPDEFHRIIEVNLLGQAYGAMAAMPYLKQQNGGALIFVSSIEGRIPIPYHSAYNASKHGILGMAETLRLEVSHTGVPISVTTILPASINTPLFEKARTKIGVEPEPLPPVYEAQMVARSILYAAEHPVRELIVGDSGYMMTFMRRLAPTLTSNFMGASGFRMQRSNEPKSAQAPDNLYNHISGYDQVQGEYPARPFSLLTWFSTHPRARMALYGGLLAGMGALVGWRVVEMRNQRRGWRYQLPKQARKLYKNAYKQVRQASKGSQKAIKNASETVVGLPLVSSLPMFRRRSVFQRWGDLMLGWWAAITSISLPFISRRKSLAQRITDRMPSMSMPSMPEMPWSSANKMTGKAAKQTSKAMDKVEKQVKVAQKRAEKAMNQVENRSRYAIKAASRSMPSKSDIKDMAKRGQVIERRQSFIERMPFGERRETVVEKMPYKK